MIPADLRARIAADYTAVRPLPAPALRVVWMLPFAALALFAAPTFFNVRSDASQLGWAATWGASIIQVVMGLAMVGAALRESIPGRQWPARQLALLIAAPVALVIAITFSTYHLSPIGVDRSAWLIGLLCLSSSLASALPVVALGNVLAARAYPTRPLVVGVLAGLGGGLAADAGWRIFCHFSEPGHVLSAHLGGVMLCAVAGAALAFRLRTPFR